MESRIAALEAEVARLKQKMEKDSAKPWWQQIVGSFANDPHYEEAMRLGRDYRESLRPRVKTSRRKTRARTRH
jgi:hypothetical protein